MLRGLSFDFWNTMYAQGPEPRRHALRVERLTREAAGHRSVDRAEIEQALKISTEFFHRYWQDHQKTPLAAERIRFMADHLKISFTEEQIEDLVDYFGRLIFEVPPERIPHIGTLIRELAQNYPLGIISDTGYISGRYIRAFLEREALLECFQSTIFSDEAGNSKPHISLFQKTARNLGVTPENLLHTGDLEHTDIVGARNAGCRSVKFIGVNASDPSATNADRVIESYDRFREAISDIFSE